MFYLNSCSIVIFDEYILMKILKFPHPNLFIKCQNVTVFGKELKVLLDAMWETMINNNGVGLAANQADLSFNMFVMEGPNKEQLYIVNPRIIKQSSLPANLNEGCLSAPGELLVVSDRSYWTMIEYQDETGAAQKKVFEGIYSVCVQHEIEHLEGKSFLESKSIPKNTRKKLSKKWGFTVK